MRPRQQKWITMIIIGLFILGILRSLISMLIPLIVFSVVAILYFFPPDRWRLFMDKYRRKRMGKKNNKNVRKAKFYVIDGDKDKNEPKRYH